MKMKLYFKFFLLLIMNLYSEKVFSTDQYCQGYRDGHKEYLQTYGKGYPGFTECPGDPGSSEKNITPYERGFNDGLLKGAGISNKNN